MGQINAYVSAPPIEGKANKEAIEALADYFKIKKGGVKLIAGQKSRLKLFEIDETNLP